MKIRLQFYILQSLLLCNFFSYSIQKFKVYSRHITTVNLEWNFKLKLNSRQNYSLSSISISIDVHVTAVTPLIGQLVVLVIPRKTVNDIIERSKSSYSQDETDKSLFIIN
jgi:hypothetical protein